MPESTIAQELREAAKRLRADASWPSEDLCLATADLLDLAANRAVSNPFGAKELIAGALKVARTVLDTSPELPARERQ